MQISILTTRSVQATVHIHHVSLPKYQNAAKPIENTYPRSRFGVNGANQCKHG